jgi:general secretion pathway protein D
MSAGCASNRATQRAHEAARLENWDAAVYYYLEALAKDPTNVRNRVELQRARLRAAEQHFRLGMAFREAGELQRARSELELTTQLDPTHQYAEVELAKVRSELAVLAQEGGAAKLEAMKRAASEMKVKPPLLNPTSSEPISLSFPNPTNVKDVYKAIGAAFGFNVLFDPKLKDSKVALELKDVTAKRALETVMQAAGHFYKVLDEKSIIVVEDTPQNRRDYEDLVVKTFFLSNADVKDVNNMLRSLIDARRIAVNEQLNSIVIRDTADKVAIAERLINANDKSKAEVLVDVELLQLDSSKLRDIGMSLSAYSFPITMDPTSITGGADKTRIPLDRLGDITRSMWGLTVPSVTISLVKSSGEAETLAQPQLRITEGEKANLVIGDKVPIPTTTFNTSNTIGSNVVPITAFNYQDVGIKIEVEPRVHHNNEVTLKLQVEVSELGENVEVSAGQKQPKIGTRTINSVIRLKDGETSLLAGLLKYSKRSSTSGVPWLSEIPVLGGLFRSNNTDFKKTDLILTLTPHIVRYPDIREEDLAPIWVGTESRITIFGNAPRVQSAGGGGGPFGEEAPGIGEPPRPEESVEPSGGGAIHFGDEGGEEGGRRTRPAIKIPEGGAIPGRRPGTGKPEGVAPSQPEGGTATLPGSDGLATVSFYPARLPVVVGGLGELTVTLEPGLAGAVAPVHLAYDPARLEVVRIEEGDVAVETGSTHVEAVHTPPLGWITVSWSGRATGAGTLLRLTVRPLAAGEVPVIFAGPIGATVGGSATVVALPVASGQGEVVSP